MLNNIEYHERNTANNTFSILIPSWNNLSYLQLCIKSIQKHSHFSHQIIVIVNEGSDGTLKWIENQKEIDYIYSNENLGICYALNSCRKLIKTEYVVYVNDDMYFLPDWDKVLFDEIKGIGHNKFMLSATMIEAKGNNPAVIIADYGTDIISFREEELLKEYKTLYKEDWSGSTWPPNILHIDSWDLIGGMSIEFSPGMYSDPDLSRKLWETGVKIFKGKGNSVVYHFGCKSTKRIKKNNGRQMFILKWGISSKTFMKDYLHIGKEAMEILPEKHLSKTERLIQKIKRIRAGFQKTKHH
ncbi:MAG: glycosyltransferase [Bacteroidales bacterium]|nr:glycosyltransferase [Bacteroidales bacterium]